MKLHEKIELLRDALELTQKTLMNEDQDKFDTGVDDTVWISYYCTLYDHISFELEKTKTLADEVKALEERDLKLLDKALFTVTCLEIENARLQKLADTLNGYSFEHNSECHITGGGKCCCGGSEIKQAYKIYKDGE
jgi:hypothetical protein